MIKLPKMLTYALVTILGAIENDIIYTMIIIVTNNVLNYEC